MNVPKKCLANQHLFWVEYYEVRSPRGNIKCVHAHDTINAALDCARTMKRRWSGHAVVWKVAENRVRDVRPKGKPVCGSCGRVTR